MPSKSKKKRQPTSQGSTSSSTNTSLNASNASNTSGESNGEQKTVIDPNILKALTRSKPNGKSNGSINGSRVESENGNGEDEDEDGHDNGEEEEDDDSDHYEYDDPLLSKTSIQRLLSDTRNVVSYDVQDDANLRPKSTLTHPSLTISKDEYILKQNQIFKELTGHQSWREKRESDLDSESNDKLLMKMLEIFVAGQDELIYNEYTEQKYLLDIIEDAAESAARYILSNQSSNMKLRSLVINYGKMKAHIGKLQSDFLQLSSARSTVDRQREHLQSALTDEFTKRIRLEHVCKGMEAKIQRLESELEKGNGKANLEDDGVEDMATRLSALTQQLQAEQSKTETQQKRLYQASAELKTIQNDIQDLKKLKDNMQEQHDKEKRYLNDHLKAKSEDILKKMEQKKVEKYRQEFQTQLQDYLRIRHGEVKMTTNDENAMLKIFNSVMSKDLETMPATSTSTAATSTSTSTSSQVEPKQPARTTRTPSQSAIPELLEMLSNWSSSPDKDSLKQLLKQFFEQYGSREKYYKSAIRDKDIQIQIFLARAKQERSIAETERNRAQVLRDQIAASSIALSEVNAQLTDIKQKYEEKFNELEKLLNSSHFLVENSVEKVSTLETSIAQVKAESAPVMDLLGKLSLSMDKTLEIIEERDSLKSKVSTLENLCRTLAATKSKMQTDLAIQTALVREMRSQNGYTEDDDHEEHHENGFDGDDTDDDYDYEEYFVSDDDTEKDHSDTDEQTIYHHINRYLPPDKARKAKDHLELLSMIRKIKQADEETNKSSARLDMFGFKSIEDVKSFINTPSNSSGNCDDNCPQHGKASPYKHTWELISADLRRGEQSDDSSDEDDTDPNSPPTHPKRFFGPERPPPTTVPS